MNNVKLIPVTLWAFVIFFNATAMAGGGDATRVLNCTAAVNNIKFESYNGDDSSCAFSHNSVTLDPDDWGIIKAHRNGTQRIRLGITAGGDEWCYINNPKYNSDRQYTALVMGAACPSTWSGHDIVSDTSLSGSNLHLCQYDTGNNGDGCP
ncbi:MAG: hypothetical protein V3T17_09995 [Pseudomonadales bacterium]